MRQRERERERQRWTEKRNCQTMGNRSKKQYLTYIRGRQKHPISQKMKTFVFSDNFHQIICIIPAPHPLYPHSSPPLPLPPNPTPSTPIPLSTCQIKRKNVFQNTTFMKGQMVWQNQVEFGTQSVLQSDCLMLLQNYKNSSSVHLLL